MEPTANPDEGRQPGGPGRFRPGETGPVPAQRPPGPGEQPGAPAAGARPEPAATNDTQMVPLGSRRPAEEPPGGTSNGSRWIDDGGFPPVETNGHRNPDLGPRHGGAGRVNGQNPVGGGTLPGSRSPFAPPPGPDTPPLYAPSPFGSAGNPPATDLPTDPLAPLDPPEDDRDGGARPAAGPPAATGSAQVPMPLGRPVSGQPLAEPPAEAGTRAVPGEAAPDEHEPWAPPHRGPAPAGDPVAAGGDDPFPGFGTVTPPSTEPGPGHTARWSGPEAAGGERPGPWSRLEASASSRVDPLPPHPLQPPAVQSSLPPELLKPLPSTPSAAPAQPDPGPGGRRSRPDEEPARTEPRSGRRAVEGEEAGRRARDEAPSGRRAARETPGESPLRPGDVDQTAIAFWDEAASGHFRAEWHEVKAQFVDDPVAALNRAHALLTEAVQELGEAMLAERDRLDPLRDTAVPDTESMRMAMRGYREFLDRILSL